MNTYIRALEAVHNVLSTILGEITIEDYHADYVRQELGKVEAFIEVLKDEAGL